ncbi:MAG: DUF805 domain-containing protein [Thiotrichaceae bacterium]
MVTRYSKLSLFGTKGRLGRIVYFLFSFIIPVSIFWVITATAGQLNRQGLISKEIAYGLILFATLVAIFMLIRLTMQRSHDLNRSGWLSALLVLFPPLIAIFWLIPGTKGINNYHEPSQPLSTLSKLFSLLLFLGLLLPIIFLAKEYSLIDNIRQLLQPYF